MRSAVIGALVGALSLAAPLVTWEIVQPSGPLRLLIGAASFLLAPPYILLATSGKLLQQQHHAALYAFAIAGNAALYAAFGTWLHAANHKRWLVRFGPIGAFFAAWTTYVVIHG